MLTVFSEPPGYAMARGFFLFFISLEIWHHEQGPQKQAYTQSLQIEPCRDKDAVTASNGKQILSGML